jgi:hypothetical protein
MEIQCKDEMSRTVSFPVLQAQAQWKIDFLKDMGWKVSSMGRHYFEGYFIIYADHPGYFRTVTSENCQTQEEAIDSLYRQIINVTAPIRNKVR